MDWIFLKALGFTRHTEDFREYYTIPQLSTIHRCKMNDFLLQLNETLDALYAKSVTADKIKTIQQMNSTRENDIQAIMKDYEADRHDKEERNT